jgi:hypothetical protein
MGYGFHEDGVRSGLEVSTAISNVPLPWATKYGQHAMISGLSLLSSKVFSPTIMKRLMRLMARPFFFVLEKFCRWEVIRMLRSSITIGKLTIIDEMFNVTLTFGDITTTAEDKIVTILVKSPTFWIRLALEFDIGMIKDYLSGDWEIIDNGANYDGLFKLFKLLIENMPNGKTVAHKRGSLEKASLAVKNMTTAWIGSALSFVWYRLTMDNTIGNSTSNINAVSVHNSC